MSLISGLLGRFGKKQPEDDLKLLREDEHKRVVVVTREIPMQGRVAQNVHPELVAAFQRICERNPVIQACLLLDTRERNADSDNSKLLVRLVLDNETQFDSVADQFAQVLKGFPSQADNTYISFNIDEFDGFMSSAIFHRTDAEHGAT